MYDLGRLRVLILAAATISLGTLQAYARNPNAAYHEPPTWQSPQEPRADSRTIIHLRWSARPGITRYRLQLATDRGFTDIVFDRVVAGTEYQINDLAPGTYFWRIAPLTTKLGEFSAPATIEVTLQPEATTT